MPSARARGNAVSWPPCPQQPAWQSSHSCHQRHTSTSAPLPRQAAHRGKNGPRHLLCAEPCSPAHVMSCKHQHLFSHSQSARSGCCNMKTIEALHAGDTTLSEVQACSSTCQQGLPCLPGGHCQQSCRYYSALRRRHALSHRHVFPCAVKHQPQA